MAPLPLLRKHACLIRCWGLAVLVLLSTATLSFAQSNPPRPTLISKEPVIEAKRFYAKFNPIPILHGPIPNTSEYRLGFEVVGGERFSYQVVGSYLNRSLLINALADDSIKAQASQYEFPGYRFQLQARYYLIKMSDGKSMKELMTPSGIYVAIHTSYAAATWKPKDQNFPRQEWTNFTLNGLVGVQLMADDDFGLDMFFGLGYKENRSYLTDYRQRTTAVDLKEAFGGALGEYIASPIKVSCGFHLVFGIL